MDRAQRFALLSTHPMYAAFIKKLSGPELQMIDAFILKNNELAQTAWSIAIRKLFVDNPNKPTNWTSMYELLQILA